MLVSLVVLHHVSLTIFLRKTVEGGWMDFIVSLIFICSMLWLNGIFAKFGKTTGCENPRRQLVKKMSKYKSKTRLDYDRIQLRGEAHPGEDGL